MVNSLLAGVVMFFTAIQTSYATFFMMILKRLKNVHLPVHFFVIKQKVFQIFCTAEYPIDFNAVAISSS